MRSAFTVLALSAIATAATQQTTVGQQKHKVTLADLQSLRDISQLQISPDGRSFAFTIDGQSQIWLLNIRDGGHARPVAEGTFPIFSPDGKHLAYYSSASGTFQLWTLQLYSGRRQQLTHFQRGIQPDPTTWAVGMSGWIYDSLRFTWSPDSKHIVFPSQVSSPTGTEPKRPLHLQDLHASAGMPLVLTASTPPDWTLAGLFRVGGFSRINMKAGKLDFSAVELRPSTPELDHLFVVDVMSKKIRRLTPDSDGYFSPDWSPDGQKVLCISWEGREHSAGQQAPTNLYTIDVITGKKSAVTHGLGYRRIPAWSPDGRLISFFGAAMESPQREYLYVLPTAGGEARNVSSRLDRRCFFAYWSPDSDHLISTCKDGANVPVVRLSANTGSVEVISDKPFANRFLLASSRSGALAWVQSDPEGPARIHLLGPSESSSRVVEDVDPQIAQWRLGEQQVIRWTTPSGNEQEGVLIKPIEYEKGRRYPLIVDAYPKLGNSFKGDPMWGNQAFASEGYAVFFPNGDGPHVWETPWKSIAQTSRAKGTGGVDVAVEDVVSGVNELIARGIVDPQRICLYGFSNGGGVVDQVITKSHQFRCAVSVAGAVAADWSSLFFIRTQSRFIADLAGTTPWSAPSIYVDLSAVYRLNEVTTPLLLADGDDDGGFLLGSIEMYNGLRYLDRDVVLLRYPKQGHGFRGAALKDFWKRENAFFAQYLKFK